jgi:hypothetical protein
VENDVYVDWFDYGYVLVTFLLVFSVMITTIICSDRAELQPRCAEGQQTPIDSLGC